MTSFVDLALPVQFFVAFVIMYDLIVATAWAASTAARLVGAPRGRAVEARGDRSCQRRRGADARRACKRCRKKAARRRNETGDGKAGGDAAAGIVAALEVGGFRQTSLRPHTGDCELGQDIFARIAAQADRSGFIELACALRNLATRMGKPRPSDVANHSTSTSPIPRFNAA